MASIVRLMKALSLRLLIAQSADQIDFLRIQQVGFSNRIHLAFRSPLPCRLHELVRVVEAVCDRDDMMLGAVPIDLQRISRFVFQRISDLSLSWTVVPFANGRSLSQSKLEVPSRETVIWSAMDGLLAFGSWLKSLAQSM